MRVAFTGSRHWTDEDKIEDVLRDLKDEYGNLLQICHGKSPGGGADAIVERLAEELGITQEPFQIRGGKDGVDGPNPRVAPLNRNKRMLRVFRPHLLIAFRAKGKSNGTDHTIREARKLGIPIKIYEEEL